MRWLNEHPEIGFQRANGAKRRQTCSASRQALTAVRIILRAATVAGTGDTVNAANMPAPLDLEDSYLLYLEALHVTDATSSMRVAGLFLKSELDATRREAADMLKHWAQTFGARRPRP